MRPDEIDGLLARVGWGILGTAADAAPYGVPVGYGWDGRRLFLATGPGRKLEAVERNPRICLTVAEVDDFDRWRSVVAIGELRWLESLGERAAAVRALARQRRMGERRVRVEDAPRLLRARLAEVVIRELSGRRRG
jgi:nitroimidazol reductase NimA-like FMN-containing flavoprotein (pyridoxamine 5'-phosphate oxidase superfamily)